MNLLLLLHLPGWTHPSAPTLRHLYRLKHLYGLTHHHQMDVCQSWFIYSLSVHGSGSLLHLVLPEVSSFSHWVLEFFLAAKEGLRTGDVGIIWD